MSETEVNSRPVSSMGHTHAEAQSRGKHATHSRTKRGKPVLLECTAPAWVTMWGLANIQVSRPSTHKRHGGLIVHMCGQTHTQVHTHKQTTQSCAQMWA